MTPGKILTFAIAAITLTCIGLYGGYKYGSDKGYKTGYEQGKDQGYSKGFDQGSPSLGDKYKIDKFDETINDYNSLVDDYNTLRENVIRYVGQIDYQSRQPITCNSSTYGIYDQYTTTNCY